MQRQPLGSSGPQVSRIALGTMTFGAESDERTAHRLLDAFVDAGGTLVDAADVYTDGVAEEYLGRWLAQRPARRDQVVLATKGRFPVSGQPGASLSARYLRSALDASLRRLQVDCVDLYQAHGPDASTPLEEVVTFFDEAVRSGKVRSCGLSNFAGWQIAKLAGLCASRVPLVSHQPQYSLLSREVEWEVLPAAADAGLGVLVWGPLAGGWLTGKYRRGGAPPPGTRLGDDPGRGLEAWDKRANARTWAILERLATLAEQLGSTPAQLAIAWVIERPPVTSAIVGARTVEQLKQVWPAADLRLDDATREALDEVSAPPTPDHPYRFLDELAVTGDDTPPDEAGR